MTAAAAGDAGAGAYLLYAQHFLACSFSFSD